MTRQGDTVWFGLYPQTKATDEEMSKMSASPNADGFFTSGKDLFVKINNANPKVHSETADTVYIPFNDKTQPVEGETYYFKLEPIEWMVLVDDGDNDAVTLVSRYYLDTHAWQTESNDGKCTKAGVPENTPANSWRYSEMRAFLNDEFLNFAFTEEEKQAIYLFGNTHTIDYRSNDESTIVNDYVAVGNRDDYDKAGNNGRPTDYTIVRGATWCYNKDHIYYYVNATFSTFGSGGSDASIDKINDAISLIHSRRPDIVIDGEMQLDAAVDERIGNKKSPDSSVAGRANVLIVPDIIGGNILYKSMSQFAGATIAGPILLGFSRPVSDLSRGSNVNDIVFTARCLNKLI